MRFTLLLFVALLSGAGRLAAQEKVNTGHHVGDEIEEVIFGHLTELNDKYKMRASEVTFARRGDLGVHYHVGPGILYVPPGELTFTEGGRATVYKAGEYFFETGNLAHTAENKSNMPLRILFVEILPKNWAAPTAVPPSAQ